jgi:hypothetical protein
VHNSPSGWSSSVEEEKKRMARIATYLRCFTG